MKAHKIFFIILGIIFYSPFTKANCKDPELRKQVAQTAKLESVDEKELLSIIAHESSCHYYTIAWNLPGKAYTAKSKFFDSLKAAKSLAEELIATKQYRVDVGIGQINNEAHIKHKGWSLEEMLNPETALNRVAQVLKERGWAHYHSSNPALASKWQGMALAALNNALGESHLLQKQKMPLKKIYSKSSLVVFNSFNSNFLTMGKSSWVIFENLQ